MTSESPIEVQTEILIEQGELKAALKLLEEARTEALSREDISALEEVLAGARLVFARAEGKPRDEGGRLAYTAQQNIRFLSRREALAAGREWVDPFAAQVAAASSQRTGVQRQGIREALGYRFLVEWGLITVGAAVLSGSISGASSRDRIPDSAWLALVASSAVVGLVAGLLVRRHVSWSTLLVPAGDNRFLRAEA